MARAALGFRAHTGWAAAVAVAGPAGAPVLVASQRIELAETRDVESAEVFHLAAEMDRAEGEQLIERARQVARRLARAAIETARAELAAAGHELVAVGVVLGGGSLPSDLAAILRSHPMIHTAEGELYRRALVDGGEACGLPVTGVAGKQIHERAAAALGLDGDAVRHALTELGKGRAKPWAQDQKESALVAWLALAPGGGARAAVQRAR
jgi:hypothetical protein